MSDLPIGIFDSGVGGLTVANELIKLLPREKIIYLGDTARVPYGSRSKEEIVKFSLELTSFLLKQRVKALVVACNTISAVALDQIKSLAHVPIIDVIEPTIQEAVILTKNNNIAIIGTEATIESKTYELALKRYNKTISVTSISCPLFVPIVENISSKHNHAKVAAEDYLQEINESDTDTLILGCTHYPLLYPVIKQTLRPDITIVDSGIPTAKVVRTVLRQNSLLNRASNSTYDFFVTGDPQKAQRIANLFFGNPFPGRFERAYLEKGLF